MNIKIVTKQGTVWHRCNIRIIGSTQPSKLVSEICIALQLVPRRPIIIVSFNYSDHFGQVERGRTLDALKSTWYDLTIFFRGRLRNSVFVQNFAIPCHVRCFSLIDLFNFLNFQGFL